MNLENKKGIDSTASAEPLLVERCESCGNSFGCGANLEGCWCSEVRLTDEQLATMSGKYERCLCRPCLVYLAGIKN